MDTIKKVLGVMLLYCFSFLQAHPAYLGNLNAIEESVLQMTSNFATAPGNTDYESKLAKISSCIPLDYNPTVRSYIELYTNRTPALSEKILSLSDIYFPIFEKTLRNNGLPIEFKYLPVTESALDANAVSRAGATGLWQLMSNTAKGLRLTVNNYVDERRDPYKSTEAAVKYLKSMYNKYDDWLLVIAAYNCGPGKVDEAIRRSGGIRNYWLLYDYLPRETRNYVPAFIACVYWMHYYLDHSLRLVPHPYANLFAGSDTLMVKGPLHLNTVSSVLNLDAAKLAFMNPALKQRILPDNKTQYCLRLPVTELWTFRQRQNLIYSGSAGLINSAGIAEKEYTDVWYKVKTGDNLSTIAAKYKCTVSQLKKWNKLKSSTLKQGQKLKVGVKTVSKKIAVAPPPVVNEGANTPEAQPADETAVAAVETGTSGNNANVVPAQQSALDADQPVKTVAKDKLYKVKKGDALLTIAKQNNCTVDELRKWNNLKGNQITAGQQLKVGVTETVVQATAGATPLNQNEPVAEDNFAIDNNIIITDDGEIIFKDQIQPTIAEVYEPVNGKIEDSNFKISDNIIITANGDIIFNNTQEIAAFTTEQEDEAVSVNGTATPEIAGSTSSDAATFTTDDNIIITPEGDILFKDQLPAGYSYSSTQTTYTTTTAAETKATPAAADAATFTTDDNIIITPEGDILFKDQLPAGYSYSSTQTTYTTTTAAETKATPAAANATTFTTDDNIIITPEGDILFKDQLPAGYSYSSTQTTYTVGDATDKPDETAVIINEDGEIIFTDAKSAEFANASAKERATASRTTAPNAEAKQTKYVVKKGDTLWSIVQKSKGVTIEQVVEANKLTYKSVLREGMELLIPAAK
ncbi:LysM peptidoglycan-binding domain-containing protein [Sphingobacteriales bacterium UPWRP_1]|nr:hypothetical protein BVG80_09895 [Sphingobacteriales bacterium TSM_CSM]PSJ78138.1 LysM peptidoglycan-binding domain-containing protein [Sphingobacteriales bacterium UPWRP_1]